MQQHDTQVGFQLPDRSAQRWLRHVQSGSGPPEVPFLSDGHEVAQQAQLHNQR